MRSLKTILFVIIVLVFTLAFVQQQRAEAKTCYDQNKQPIPCPKSNYIETQQAAKQATNSISSTNTPIPPTETPPITPTNTSLPTSTDTPLPTQTIPPAQQSVQAVQVVCPSPAAAVTNNPGINPPGGGNAFIYSLWLFSGGGLMGGILIGLLVPAVLKRSIGRERITNGDSNQGDADSNYSYPEFHSKSLGEVHETITDRPEKDEIQ